MPRITPQTELDQLLALIATQPDGMGIDAIAQALGDSVKRRTLQRRLATLVAQGHVQMVGGARALRYQSSPRTVNLAARLEGTGTVQALAEVYVPASPEGKEIKAYVRQPRAMRAPVGYRQAFLEQYHPNHTAYLRPSLRDQLHSMGTARTEQTPAGTFARDILNRLLIDLSWASSMSRPIASSRCMHFCRTA
jgi:hypothetical protein